MVSDALKEKFKKFPVVGILRGFTLDQASAFMPTLLETEWPYLEVTMNTPDAAKQIKSLSENYAKQIAIGAGTVCNMDELKRALDAGATFIVTPIVNPEVIMHCVENKIEIYPGAFSPSEIYLASSLGATMVKLFPANHLGPGYIKDIKGPLSSISILATGGISPDNVRDYLEVGVKGFGIGSCVFNKEKAQIGEWTWITNQINRLKNQF